MHGQGEVPRRKPLPPRAPPAAWLPSSSIINGGGGRARCLQTALSPKPASPVGMEDAAHGLLTQLAKGKPLEDRWRLQTGRAAWGCLLRTCVRPHT